MSFILISQSFPVKNVIYAEEINENIIEDTGENKEASESDELVENNQIADDEKYNEVPDVDFENDEDFV